MKKVVKEAKEIAGLENIKLYFTEEEIRKLDGEIEYEKGLKDGIEQNKQEMVINMYNKNISNEIISECVNLPIEKVKEIILDEKNKS